MLRFAISDRRALGPPGAPESALREALAGQARRLAMARVDFYLVREKDLPAGELAELSRAVVQAGRGSPMRVLVSGRADVALAAGLAGVHLSASDGELRPSEVRTVFQMAGAPEPWVSVSCHTPAEVRTARQEDASAILFAPVFGKTVQGREVAGAAGLAALAEACVAAGAVPVLALGGVTEQMAPGCLLAGASGIAGIRIFL